MTPTNDLSHRTPNKKQRHGRGSKWQRATTTNNRQHERKQPPKRQQQSSVFPPWTLTVEAAALGPSLPPLLITYTNEQHVVAEWLRYHVFHEIHGTCVTNNDMNNVQCLGFDTETKPCYSRESALASTGPDTLQLAKADGNCLVLHLSRMERLQDLQTIFRCDASALLQLSGDNNNDARLKGYVQLSRVLMSQNIAKAGVSIDDDALQLCKSHMFQMSCRLDLRNIALKGDQDDDSNDNDNDSNNQKDGKPAAIAKEKKQPAKSSSNNETGPPTSLKGLSEYYVKGLVLPKKKKLQMSNWSLRLSKEQIGYAAADAFAGVMVVETLAASPENQHTKQSLIDMVCSSELSLDGLRQDRERRKRERKREQEKRRQEKKKEKQQQESNNQKGQNADIAKPNANNAKDDPGGRKKREAPLNKPGEGDSPLHKRLSTSLKSSR